VLDDAAVVAVELQRRLARRDALHGVEERVEVHETPELPIGDDAKPELLLPGHDAADRRVLQLVQACQVLRPLRVEQRGVPGLVDPVDLVEQLARPLQAPDVIGAQVVLHWGAHHRTGDETARWIASS
jgi:hypothetical protein